MRATQRSKGPATLPAATAARIATTAPVNTRVVGSQNQHDDHLEHRERQTGGYPETTKPASQFDSPINCHCRVTGEEKVVRDLVGHQQ